MKKRIVCAMLAAMMVSSIGTTALAAVEGNINNSNIGNTGSVSVSTQVENPVYKVSVPASLNLYIDPFNLLGGAQVTSEDFVMINKSNVALEIGATVTVSGASVDFKDKAEEVKEEGDDKTAYVEVEIPGTVNEVTAAATTYFASDGATAIQNVYTADNATGFYVTTASGAGAVNEATAAAAMVDTTNAKGAYTTSKKVKVDTASGTALSFVLDKADYVDIYTKYNDEKPYTVAFENVAENKKGSAVFRFSGKVNSLATWSTDDLTGNIAYTFKGLTDALYAEKQGRVTDNAHAYVAADIGTTATAVASGGAITITVVDDDEQVVSGAAVKITNASGAAVANGATNAQGVFKKEGLATGTYGATIISVPSGYKMPTTTTFAGLSVTQQNTAPSIAVTSHNLVAGRSLSVTFDLGSGNLAATGITKIVNKLTNVDVPTARYSVSGNTITFDSTFTTNNAASAANGLNFDIVFNNGTTVTITLRTQ